MKLLYLLLIFLTLFAILYKNIYENCYYQYFEYYSNSSFDCNHQLLEILDFIDLFVNYLHIFLFIAVPLNFIYDIINIIKEKDKEQQKLNITIIVKRLLLGILLLFLSIVATMLGGIFVVG